MFSNPYSLSSQFPVNSCAKSKKTSINEKKKKIYFHHHPLHAFASIFFPSSAILAFRASAALFSSSIILNNCFSLASS